MYLNIILPPLSCSNEITV